VVLKPASLTPLTALRLGELALAAGLPEGVLHVAPGEGGVVGQRLVDHPDVGKIVFTGSTEVGQGIMAGCAAHVKRLTLELGGKSANIVFADADLERAVATAPASVFDNAGQDCCARSRILVERSVYDRFLGLLEEAVGRVRVGDPADAATEMGPLISAGHRERVASFVPEGAPVAFRGQAPGGPGFWFPPTVLAPVSPATRCSARRCSARCGGGPLRRRGRRRPAGQRLPLRAVRVDLDREPGARAAGGFKRSGLGRELGPDALDAFTEVKNVFIATDRSDA
jgi:acyl-CoA reductase-like NAD-dependent aldehyde dehydrogenase